MRLHRFYVTQPLGEEVVIDDVSVIKQWTKVLRYKQGDFVILFNGTGKDITYSLSSVNSKECTLTQTKESTSYIPDKKVTLYLSILKKDNFELVVQKATELGISTIVPIISERSEKKDINVERLQKILTEASEQCGRGDIPVISPIITLSLLLEKPFTHDVTFVLQMGGIDVSQEHITNTKDIGFLVGPEGGWSETEEETFKKHHLMSVSLGKTVLRAETAAIVGSAFLIQGS
jgi:16S rRNA (uracil1498-N3)-methyltransferase